MNKCPLCHLDLSNEHIYYEDEYFIVLQTKALKGHKERIMIVTKEHIHTVPMVAYEAALHIIERVGRVLFNYTNKFVVMDSTFATINEHWHLVVTDLEPNALDFEQILRTRWLRVFDRTWD